MRILLLDYLEYLPMRAATALVDALPVRAALSAARGIGRLSWHLLRKRRRTAIRNVMLSGITTDPAEAVRIARASFESFAMLSVESLKAMKVLTPDTVNEHVTFSLPPATQALIDKAGQPVIFASAHLGNWEISGHLISFSKPLVAVARTLDNPFAQRFLAKRNPRRRIEIVAKHSRDRLALLRPLRSGKFLGLICDQHAASNGVEVSFFGRPAQTVTSPARMHLATGVPIVFGVCFRTGPMQFEMAASEPLSIEPTGDREADIRAITQRICDITERFILRHPEQYLWAHRRWRGKAADPSIPTSFFAQKAHSVGSPTTTSPSTST